MAHKPNGSIGGQKIIVFYKERFAPTLVNNPGRHSYSVLRLAL